MIDVKEAVIKAKEYLNSLYADRELPNLLLEEVELESDKYWLITFGFQRSLSYEVTKNNSMIAWGGGANEKRTPIETMSYKTVVVDAENGNALRLKIRDV